MRIITIAMLLFISPLAPSLAHASSSDVEHVRSVMKQFAAAARAGDSDRLIALTDVGDAEPERSLLILLAGVSHLRAEAEARFGRPPANTTGKEMTNEQIDRTTVTVDGDAATAETEDPMRFRRVGGKWLISMRGAKLNTAGLPAPALRRLGQRAKDLGGEVRAGKFQELAEVESAFATAIEEETGKKTENRE